MAASCPSMLARMECLTTASCSGAGWSDLPQRSLNQQAAFGAAKQKTLHAQLIAARARDLTCSCATMLARIFFTSFFGVRTAVGDLGSHNGGACFCLIWMRRCSRWLTGTLAVECRAFCDTSAAGCVAAMARSKEIVGFVSISGAGGPGTALLVEEPINAGFTQKTQTARRGTDTPTRPPNVSIGWRGFVCCARVLWPVSHLGFCCVDLLDG